MTTKLAAWAEIRGSSKHVSKQEVRALLQATRTVFEYHNITPRKEGVITVKFQGLIDNDPHTAGQAWYATNTILLLDSIEFSALATVIVHEMVHLHFPFPSGEEKLTSTLTSRIKADVIAIANMLVVNSQKRAAYIAHTKLSYRPDAGDFYDMNQYHVNHAPSAGEKYRRGQSILLSGSSICSGHGASL